VSTTKICGRRKREQARNDAHRAVKEWGGGGGEEDTPTKSDSLYDEEEEGEVTPPPLYPPRVTPPLFSDITGR
jgi:hypothetical protein